MNDMGTLQLLPDDILRTQVCQECFQYLSVGPITINTQKETICGRCNVYPTKSLFNLVASGFLFKCTNHFNGCNEILPSAQIKDHEDNCLYPHQDCFFCSFYGNLSQILNHSMKYHSENISLDGLISFSLLDGVVKKTVLFLFENNIFLITIEVRQELFIVLIRLVTPNFTSIINQYGIVFRKSDEPADSDLVLTDFGLLHEGILNRFEKPKDELTTFFGPGSTLCCRIVVGQFSVGTKEVEVQKRYETLRRDEEELSILKRKLATEREQLNKKLCTYDSAMHVIKIMSHNLLKCCSCLRICETEIYFCPKMHCTCKDCLQSICNECKVTRQFKKLPNIEHFVVPCDWTGCNRTSKIRAYLKHKTQCPKRPFKCPLQDCNDVLLSVTGLIEHWHSEVPKLYQSRIILYETFTCEEFYWLLDDNLYHVLVDFDESFIQVLFDEINVLPNNISFKCDGYDGDEWEKIDLSEFCGKIQIYKSTEGKNKTTKTNYYNTQQYSFNWTQLKIYV